MYGVPTKRFNEAVRRNAASLAVRTKPWTGAAPSVSFEVAPNRLTQAFPLSLDIRPENRAEFAIYKVWPLSGARHAPQEKGIESREAARRIRARRIACEVKVRAEAALNHNARNAEYAFRDTENEPLYHFLAHLEIAATCTYLDERAGDTFDLTIYGEDHPDSDVFWKLKDVQVIGEYHAPQYREYRGERVPVYDPPKGMGTLDRERGRSHWRGAIWAQPRFLSDALTLLGQCRLLFMEIVERKIERRRWIQGITLQSTDPAEE